MEKTIRPETRLLFLETLNPLTEVADIRALSDLAHENGCLLVVDNCFCTPALQLPLALGADIVIHSATKYLDGQGPLPGMVQWIGPADTVGERSMGCCVPAAPPWPFNAWVFLKGLETQLREAHSDMRWLWRWLESCRRWAGPLPGTLMSHPSTVSPPASRKRPVGICSFEVKGAKRRPGS